MFLVSKFGVIRNVSGKIFGEIHDLQLLFCFFLIICFMISKTSTRVSIYLPLL